MSDWMDVISFRDRGGKNYAHKIGSAKENDKGGINVYLDSLPIPDKDGRVSLLISARRERDGGRPEKNPERRTPRRDEFDDDQIPF